MAAKQHRIGFFAAQSGQSAYIAVFLV